MYTAVHGLYEIKYQVYSYNRACFGRLGLKAAPGREKEAAVKIYFCHLLLLFNDAACSRHVSFMCVLVHIYMYATYFQVYIIPGI